MVLFQSTATKPAVARKGLMSGIKSVLLALPLLAGISGTSYATEIRMGLGQPETHAHSYGLTRYADYLKTNGGIDTKIFFQSLLNMSEMPNGLRDGIVDIGNVVTAYKPAEYSETNLFANLSMLATLGDAGEMPAAAMSGAMLEYILFNCPGCLDQYKSENQVFLGTASTSPYIMLCREPVNTLAQMKGKKLRSGAANFGRWAEHVGATKVSLPGNEIYDAMSQGVVDCAMLSITTLIEAQHIDVTKALLFGVPGGVFAGLANNAVNLDTWRSLTNEERAVLIKGTAQLVTDIIVHQRETEIKALELAKEKGLEIADADTETLADYEKFVEGDLAIIATEMENQGVPDAAAKVKIASDLIEKWKGKTKGITSKDADALTELYWTEIYSKLDPATYAMQ